MFTRLIQGLTAFLLCALPVLGPAKDLQPNTGTIDLVSDITMQVQIAQPGGACASGYAWHSTYGGCRRAVLQEQQQREACGVDYAGAQTRVRTRTQYILQATGEAANDPWSAWQAWDRSACVAVPRRVPGVIPDLIALVLGGGLNYYNNGTPTHRASPFKLPRGTRGRGREGSTYAVTLDRTTAQLRCVLALETTSGNGENVWSLAQAWLLGAGESFSTDGGHCHVAQHQTQAHIAGNCDWTSGGDADLCMHGARTVSVLSVSPCSAIVAVFDQWQRRQSQREYPLCP